MIRVNNLTKTFHFFTAVKDISLHLEPGEIFAFPDPNDAGHSPKILFPDELTMRLDPQSRNQFLDEYQTTQRDRKHDDLFDNTLSEPCCSPNRHCGSLGTDYRRHQTT